MPATIDLTGRRFGALVVVERAGRLKYGSLQPAWRCRCDCGNELVVPRQRLGYADHLLERRDLVTMCTQCREATRTCAECGRPYRLEPGGRTITCSDECAQSRIRAAGLRHYYKRMSADPHHNVERHAAQQARRAQDPDATARYRQQQQSHQARRKQRALEDPAYAERLRESARKTYANHAAEVQAARREHRASLTPEERAAWDARSREYSREWRRRWRAEVAADPILYARHQARYREYRAEWLRRRELGEIASVGSQLIQRLEDNDES